MDEDVSEWGERRQARIEIRIRRDAWCYGPKTNGELMIRGKRSDVSRPTGWHDMADSSRRTMASKQELRPVGCISLLRRLAS